MAKHSTRSPQERLKEYIVVEKNDLWAAVIYSAAIGVFTLALPVATQSIVNTIALGNLTQPLILLAILVLVARLLSGVLQGLRVWAVELIQRRIFVRVSSDTINRLLRAPAHAFENHHGPELLNRFFDVVTLQKSGATLLVDGLSVVMQTAIGMILLGLYHPWLLAFDFILLASILVVIFPLGSGAVNTSVNESKAKYDLVAWLQEVARHSTSFRHPAAMKFAVGKTDALVGAYLGSRASHFRILLRQILGTLGLHAFASATLLGIGGWLVMERQLTLGQLVAAELVVELVLSGFAKLGKHLELYYDLAAAVDKLGYLQDLPLERSGSTVPAWNGHAPEVALRSVTFAYPNGREALRDTGIVARGGERVGITGSSGGGKSTMFDLMFGLREPASGSIEIDGIDVREMKRSSLREQVALVRDAEIFEGTVRENVCMGRDLDTLVLRRALSAAGVLEAVLELPQGLDTKLLTGGLPLSAGQAMRLVMARAIAGNPKVLIVDEALDHSANSQDIGPLVDLLFAKGAPWTLLLASSNPALIDKCDSVYRIENAQFSKVR